MIAYDTATVNISVASASNSFSHTCTGSNLVLTVGVFSTAGDTITGITYNSVAMTQVRKRDLGSEYLYVYTLAAPTTGANTLTCSFSGSTTSRAHALSLTGCKQTGIPDAQSDTTSASTSALTSSVTTVADNCWGILFTRSTGTVSAGTGSTERPSAASSTSAIFDSNAALTPAGSQSMTANISPASATSNIMISLAPFVAASSSKLALLGVG